MKHDLNMEKLTKQEEEVMLQVWRLGRCTTKEILQQLPEPHPPYTTTASVVNNLKRKGYLNAEQRGLTYHLHLGLRSQRTSRTSCVTS